MRISVDPKPLFIALLAAALIGLSYPVAAQLSVEDISLIRERDFREQLPSGRKVTLMRIGPNALTRYNPVSLSFSGLLFFYQKVVSTQLAANCPYEISCSNFSKKTITEYG